MKISKIQNHGLFVCTSFCLDISLPADTLFFASKRILVSYDAYLLFQVLFWLIVLSFSNLNRAMSGSIVLSGYQARSYY